MTAASRIIAPAIHTYDGGITTSALWETWEPRPGDILVSTPPKCGTTWTQSILTMLAHGTTDLPRPVPVLSPWVDAALGDADQNRRAIAAQTGRRVLKTHTPADGFPIWEGVTVVAVYRHPLDVMFSLRKHVMNQSEIIEADTPYVGPVSELFRFYVEGGVARDNFGYDTMAKICLHYTETVCSGRLPDVKLFHYADMVRDGHGTVAALARAIGIDDPALIDKVAEATSFASMKSNAANFAPVGGSGFWKDDGKFFDSASSRKWDGVLSEAQVERFHARLAELVPGDAHRRWLLEGNGAPLS